MKISRRKSRKSDFDRFSKGLPHGNLKKIAYFFIVKFFGENVSGST